MTHRLTWPLSALLVLAAAPALAQTADRDRHQEGIVTDSTAATSAITKTEDTPVIEQNEEDRDGDMIGEGRDIDVVRETPDPDPVPRAGNPQDPNAALAVRGAAPDVEPGDGATRMFPGQIAPTNMGPTGSGRILAADLKDYTVRLVDGQEVGAVETLIIDLQSGRVEQVVVSTADGLLGIGDARVELPFSEISAVDTSGRQLGVNISREQLESLEAASANRE